MKYLFFTLLTIVILSIITTTIVVAQPGLPTSPSQAPIDGGLGLLAAAGGAYAYRKLKAKKQ